MSLALSEAAYNIRCNSDQQSAVEKLTEGVFLVHGPPGTGVLSILLLSACSMARARCVRAPGKENPPRNFDAVPALTTTKTVSLFGYLHRCVMWAATRESRKHESILLFCDL